MNPSGYAAARESIEAKIARRTREADFLFRHICRDCGGKAVVPSETFDPQGALDGTRRPPTTAQSSEER